MRAVYLVRHGQPEKPAIKHLCVGRLDLPLSQEGKQQARSLGSYFGPLLCAGQSVKVISSPLERCRDTASAISPVFEVMDDFLEVDMGEWTGRSFEDIKKIWPEIYEARGKDMINTVPPGGESLKQCGERALMGLRKALESCPGSDLIIAAHDGLMRMLYAGLTGSEPDISVPTGSIIRLLLFDAPDRYLPQSSAGSSTHFADPGKAVWLYDHAKMPDELPPVIPDEQTCLELLKEAETPPAAAAHCRAVADMAMKMCGSLENTGINLNAPLVYAGAMLHDIMKGRKHHAAAGAEWLFDKGYASVASVVGDHMFLSEETEELINEKTVVFLADKLIKETSRVTLEERYLADPSPEKKPYAKAHYEQAKHLIAAYKKYINI